MTIGTTGIKGTNTDGYTQYFTSSTSGPMIQGKYTATERYLTLRADDINLLGSVKINGTAPSLVGHTHTNKRLCT